MYGMNSTPKFPQRIFAKCCSPDIQLLIYYSVQWLAQVYVTAISIHVASTSKLKNDVIALSAHYIN